jgi:serine/threonine protein kinase
MIGQRLGPYEIVEQLGKGGMATVYRAFHPQMERFVAVKIIHAALAQGEEGMERFKQEARLIARLEHPHLLPVYDYDPANNPPYIVMRYLEGGTLKEVIESKQTLPLNEIAYLMRQITSALDYAHRNSVIHRDIKPSNIMIDADGNAYLTDFGIARIVGEAGMTQTGFAVGTPGYMSPEQGMGVANIDGRTDVYALGVMVFEMATGQAPYRGETPMAVLMQHIQAPLPSALAINPNLPEDFDKVLQKALAKEPDERYATPGEFANALSTLVDNSDMAATPANLKTVAVKAIKQIQDDRDTREISRILKDFQGTRSSGIRAIGSVDAKTRIKSTDRQRQAGLGGSNWMMIGAALIVVAVIIGGGFFLYTQTQNANATATAESLAAVKTSEAQVAVAANQTATQEQQTVLDTTATANSKPSEIPTRGPSPTASSTPNFAGLRATRILTLRSGPADNYAEIGTIEAGEELEIVGRNGRWYQVLLPTGKTGWVLNSPLFVDIFGPVNEVAVVEASTITPTPSSTPNQAATQTVIARQTQNVRATTSREAANEQATQDALATIEQATQNARDALEAQQLADANATATENAITTENAQATNQQATANAQATNNAIATQDAIATQNAQATNQQAAANAQATNNAIATQDAIATQNAQATNQQATANVQATNNAIATQDAIATQNAQATNQQAAANAQATNNAIATQDAIATQNAQATQNVVATVDAQSTNNAQATIDVIATFDAQAAATQAALPGRMPYLQDFSDAQLVLDDSIYDAEGWAIGPGAGEDSVLVGSARVSQAFTLLGNPEGGLPEWAGKTDFVLSFRMNMDAQEGGRLVFRYKPGETYYAVDIAPGRIRIKRGERGYDPEVDRERERFIGNPNGYQTLMQVNNWYDISIWVEGRRIYIFIDDDLIAAASDNETPLPGSGNILFQTLNRTRDIYFDDVVVQTMNPASDHFQGSRFSTIWNASTNTGKISLEREANDDEQFVRMWRDGQFTAAVNLGDLEIRTRLYNEQGGFVLYLRESDEGALRLTEDAGNLIIATINSRGTAQQISTVRNFYNYNLWEDLRIRYIGNRLTIWISGEQEFSGTVSDLPPGQIRFETRQQDIVRIDDFLLIEPVR